MATTKVKLLLNLGWQDADGLGLGNLTAEELADGAVVDVDEIQADKMVNRMRCAVPYDPSKERKTVSGKPAKATAREKFGQVAPLPMGSDEHLEGEVVEDVETEGSEVSPVAYETAEEAKDKISRMHSVDKLEEIVLTDQRKTVVDAAQKRLDEIQKAT